MALNPEQRREAADAIEREVARGALTPEQAEEHRRQFGITPDGPRGVVTATDLEIARQLAGEAGVSELDFFRRHAREGDTAIEAMRAEIDQRRSWLQQVADERAVRAFADSPEGRKLKAAEVADEQAARKALAERARLLLTSEGTFPASDVEKLPNDEAIVAAGFETTPDPASDPVANAAKAEGGTDQ